MFWIYYMSLYYIYCSQVFEPRNSRTYPRLTCLCDSLIILFVSLLSVLIFFFCRIFHWLKYFCKEYSLFYIHLFQNECLTDATLLQAGFLTANYPFNIILSTVTRFFFPNQHVDCLLLSRTYVHWYGNHVCIQSHSIPPMVLNKAI